MELREEVKAAVRQLQRGLPSDRGVVGRQLEPWVYASRATIYRVLAALASAGEVRKVGDRRGYRIET